MITANRPFNGWDDVLPDKYMGIAAIDRLVHHATIFEMTAECYRCSAAQNRRMSLSDVEHKAHQQHPDNQTENTATP